MFAGAQAITKLYAVAGYALCLAYLLAQDIEGGVVKVHVVEGYIEAVEVAANDAKLARVVRQCSQTSFDAMDRAPAVCCKIGAPLCSSTNIDGKSTRLGARRHLPRNIRVKLVSVKWKTRLQVS